MGLFLACLSLQALLPQQNAVPRLQYALWEARYPWLARSVDKLGLNTIASTWWFWGLGFALAGSLGLSAGRRAFVMMRTGPSPRGSQIALGVIPSGQSLPEVTAVLRHRGYATSVSQEGVAGRKGTPGSWGSLLFHGGLVLLFLGVLLSSATRFRGFVELAPGQTFQETNGYLVERRGVLAPQGLDLSVTVLEMGVAFWPDATVKDIWAQVAVQEGDSPVVEGVVRRNQSLRVQGTLQGTSLTLGSPFGAAALLRYTPADGSGPLQGYVHFPAESPQNRFTIPGAGLETEAALLGPWRQALEGPSSSSPPFLQLTLRGEGTTPVPHDLGLGESMAVAGGELAFDSMKPWALFMVSQDRGLPVMVLGGLAAVAGLALALFIIPRWVWIRPADGGWQVTGQTPWAEASFLVEMRRIAVEIEGSRQ
ncbi:MAG: cytochrome c biogenesis protein ResB [Chloroflexi bacterium]|nr:cytochrome c biogenesis protein ResB [Chloroflexota bacterium]